MYNLDEEISIIEYLGTYQCHRIDFKLELQELTIVTFGDGTWLRRLVLLCTESHILLMIY